MDNAFPDWVKKADEKADHGDIQRWWDGVLSVARDQQVSSISLVRLSSGCHEQDDLATFQTSFRVNDSGFRVRGNEQLAAIFAGASLLQRLVFNAPDSLPLALVVRASRFAGLVLTCGGHIEAAAANNLKTAEAAARGASSNHVFAIPNVAAAPGGDEMLTLTENVAALKSSNDRLAAQVRTCLEETNILWWAFGGASRDGVLFKETSPLVLPFVLGGEFADLVEIHPEPMAMGRLLTHLIATTGQDPDAPINIGEALAALSEMWKARITQSCSTGLQSVLPIHRAICRFSANSSTWQETSPAPTRRTVPAATLAHQFALERLAIAAVGEKW